VKLDIFMIMKKLMKDKYDFKIHSEII